MSKLLTAVLAAVFAVVTVSPVAFAQDQKKDQKKAQVDKGTPAQGTVRRRMTSQDRHQEKDHRYQKKAEPRRPKRRSNRPSSDKKAGFAPCLFCWVPPALEAPP
jgi:hypothetical protein